MMGTLPLTKILLFLLLAVYAAAETPCLKYKDVSPKRYITHKSKNYPLVLGVSERLSHKLTTQVFKIFLNEVLGYPDVTTMHMEPSNNTDGIIRQFFDDFSNDNDISLQPMVDLETWVPLSDNSLHEPYYSSKVIECGSTGPPVRYGWFAPTDVLKKVLNRTIIVYDQFRDQLQTSVYSLLEEDIASIPTVKDFEPRWCKGVTCATLIASVPSATEFVQDDIETMMLYVRVLWVGDHFTSVVNRLLGQYGNRHDDKRSNKIPLIVGHTLELLAFDRKNFTNVVFPPCEHYGSLIDEGQRNAGCNYEGQRIVKLVWDGILGAAETVHDAITRIEFTATDYQELTDIYFSKQNPSDSDRIFSTACQWMKNHRDTVLRWRPQDEVELSLIGIFPLSRPVFSPAGIYIAAQMAIEDVNNADLLSNYKLKLLLEDGECRADVVMRTFISYIVTQFRKIVGILGPACSETVEPLAGVATHFETVVISYSAEGSSFSDRTKYPYFFRTIGENRQYQYVYQELFREFKWKRVATLSEDGTKYTEYVSQTQDLLIKEGISFIANRKFSQSWMNEPGKMKEYLQEFKSKEARIIIADMNEAAAKALMCEAYHMNMTAKNGFVWFLPSWLMPFWLDQEQNLVHNVTSQGHSVYCTSHQMQEAIDAHLSLSHAFFAPDNETLHTNKTVKQWKDQYRMRLNYTNPSDYAGYAYDAVWLYAKALDALIKENQTHISNLHSRNVTEKYVHYIQNTNFSGVSGQIEFKDGPSRNSTQVNIYQWHSFSRIDKNGTLHGERVQVGIYDPRASGRKKFVLNGKLKWLTDGGKVPWDGTPEGTCIVDGLAKLLNTECQTALIVANIVGIGLILLVVTVGFLVIKHRYDQKVQLTQKYMKSLGIDLLSVSAMNNLDKWEIPKDRVVINRTLGQGAFGTVYGGEAYFDENGWMAVAVKTLKVGSTTEEKLDFLSEAEVMKRFDHKNIVQLLAVCTKSEPVYTIMEFMLYGDLKTFLLARRHLVNDGLHDDSDEISSKKLTNMALDIARALSYLAELKYVHRDVACRNCLVNASRVVKLGDFGMTRPMCDNDYYRFNRKGMLPVRWMAPESLMLGIFTPASDIWSFGVVLYEIITFGNFPFQGMSNNQVLDYVKEGKTLSVPAGVKANLETLVKSCWNSDAQKRPPAAEIVEFLANSPRIISPCLDVPLSSVPPMEDTTFGLQFSEGKTRKFSMTLRQRVSPSNDVRPWTDFSEPLLLNNRATGSNFVAEDITMDHDSNFPL